jgi:DNA repair protein RadC
MTRHTSIADMPAAARPRERLQRLGPGRLRDAELLALVIGSGTRTTSSLELARLILKQLGGPGGLRVAGTEQLQDIPGVGAALAARVAAAMELARRGAPGPEGSAAGGPPGPDASAAGARPSRPGCADADAGRGPG